MIALAEDAARAARIEVPCSAAQRRFWVLDRLDPGDPSLNVAVRWRLEGHVSSKVAERAFRSIIERHEILRVCFEQSRGGPVQFVVPRVPFSIPVVDLTTRPEQEALAEAERIARIEARTSFDLSNPPLLRVTLLRVRQDLSILLLTAHHTVCDGWSVGVLAAEFGEIYAAIDAGRDPQLPDLGVTYADFAAWENEQLAGEALKDDLEYWARVLKGMAYFELRPDRQRPSHPATGSDIRSVLLPRSLTDALEGFSQRHECTFFMTMLATFLTLLNRYSGETDIGVGTQVAGREEVELESLVGVFINTVVLRGDLAGDPTFTELLDRTRDLVLGAFEHHRAPLEKVIEILKPARDLNRNPLFSINFIFQRSFIQNRDCGSFRLVDSPSFSAGALYDLNFFLVEREDGWRLSCEYKADLFERATVDRLLEHFQNLLRAALADPARRLSTLAMLGDSERERLLVDLNRTDAPYPSNRTLHKLFVAQAAQTPERTAVVFEDSTLSYAELDARSNRLANHLRELGVGPDVLVAVCLERSLELMVALLGVLKAGGAYVPLDPSYPGERLAFMLKDCDAAVLVTQERLRARLPCQAVRIVTVDGDWGVIGRCPADCPASGAAPDNLAYCIYTSGSTGKPKGALNTHRGIVNRLAWMQEAFRLTGEDRILQKTPVSFDVSVWELFWPLLYGAQVVMARPGGHQDPAYLVEAIERHGITVAHFVPSMLNVFLERRDLHRCRSLRDTICSGEALSASTQNEFLRALPSRLHNLYGPTETAVDVTAWHCVPMDNETSVPIGRPIANIRLYVLDAHGEPMPFGAAGELYIGGVGVGRGYLNRPELTRERFIDSPFVAGDRLYRTGDRVRYRADGNLEFLGRLDHQVKLRGLRIELGEIEAALRECPGVRDAAVIVREDAPGDQRLAAYLVCDEAADDSFAAVRANLAARLPDYMVPADFRGLPALPLNPSGKLDRAALPRPQRAQARRGPPEALSETEARLASLWRAVLHREDIGRHDNFFEVGGHSLLAAQLLARIEAELNQRLTLASMFKSPTIAAQAELVRRAEPRDFEFRQVVKVQPNGSRPPIIAVHNTGIFYGLSKRLGSDQPFTSLQLFDPSLRVVAPPESIEEIAAGYVDLIRHVQPSGPYILAGWCVAGVIAFEVGRQLQQMGAEVPVLFMMDTWAPGYLKRLGPWRAFLAEYSYRLKLIGRDWAGMTAGTTSIGAFLSNRLIVKRLQRWLRRPRKPARAAAPADARALTDETYDAWLLEHVERAAKRYEARPASLKVVVFRSARQPVGAFLDRDMGWRDLALAGVETVVIVGDHTTMFQPPGVETIGRHVATHCDQVAHRG